MQLTKEHFDQAIRSMATTQEISELKGDTAHIRETVDQHTGTLDAIAKNTADWNAEMTVMRSRMDRYEVALKTVGKKLNLDLDVLLH